MRLAQRLLALAGVLPGCLPHLRGGALGLTPHSGGALPGGLLRSLLGGLLYGLPGLDPLALRFGLLALGLVALALLGLGALAPAQLPPRRPGLLERVDDLRADILGGARGLAQLRARAGALGEQVERPQSRVEQPRGALDVGEHRVAQLGAAQAGLDLTNARLVGDF